MKYIVCNNFLRDDRGATAVEFAVVSGVFFVLMMGIIEFGLYTMTQVAIESAVTQASRTSAIGTVTPGSDRVTTVTNLIRQKTSGLPSASSVIISAARVSDGGTTPPDLCLNNGSNNPPTTGATCPAQSGGTVVFVEVNGVPGYQGNGSTSLGSAGELVEVRVSYPWRVLFPILSQYFGNNGVVLITASTVVKNEPF